MNVIEIKDLKFSYPGAKAPVLKGVDLEIEKGDFVAIIGNNGCGKSTLCKVMNGLMPGSEFVTPMTMAEKILVGIDIAAVVIILALAYFIFRGFKPTKKKAAKLAAKAETKAEGQKK